MKLGILGRLIGILLMGLPSLLAQNSVSGTGKPEPATQITLTAERPAAYFPVAPQTIVNQPSTVELKITGIVNPGKTALEISAHLSYRSATGDTTPRKMLIGSFGLYPVDQPGVFQLRSSAAFARLKAATKQPVDVRLLLEMRRLHQSQPWGAVAVTVAQPEWRTEPAK